MKVLAFSRRRRSRRPERSSQTGCRGLTSPWPQWRRRRGGASQGGDKPVPYRGFSLGVLHPFRASGRKQGHRSFRFAAQEKVSLSRVHHDLRLQSKGPSGLSSQGHPLRLEGAPDGDAFHLLLSHDRGGAISLSQDGQKETDSHHNQRRHHNHCHHLFASRGQ